MILQWKEFCDEMKSHIGEECWLFSNDGNTYNGKFIVEKVAEDDSKHIIIQHSVMGDTCPLLELKNSDVNSDLTSWIFRHGSDWDNVMEHKYDQGTIYSIWWANDEVEGPLAWCPTRTEIIFGKECAKIYMNNVLKAQWKDHLEQLKMYQEDF